MGCYLAHLTFPFGILVQCRLLPCSLVGLEGQIKDVVHQERVNQ